jgi:hypothetical protein
MIFIFILSRVGEYIVSCALVWMTSRPMIVLLWFDTVISFSEKPSSFIMKLEASCVKW